MKDEDLIKKILHERYCNAIAGKIKLIENDDLTYSVQIPMYIDKFTKHDLELWLIEYKLRDGVPA